jgi:glycosyltransferase involved in cell wall biosynthesis
MVPERTWAVYDQVSVVAVPSRWPEPFGMVGIEAMRRARPVAGAAHGGIPEWLEDGAGGLLFEPGSARDLARAMEALLADRTAGERAHAQAEARFQHSRSVDAVEDLLTGLATKGEPGHDLLAATAGTGRLIEPHNDLPHSSSTGTRHT